MTDAAPKKYYDESDDIPLYWEKRYQEWLEHPDWGVFETKAKWFNERFDHLLPPSSRLPTERTPIGRVLDWGCGNAMYAVPLLERFRTYVGFDTSPTALEIARQYFSAHRPDLMQRMYLNLYTGQPGNWERHLSGRRYDLIISITVLQHQLLPARLSMIENIKELLEPGARYLGLEMIGNTQAYDMPPMDEAVWRQAWEPWEIVFDNPPGHPRWAADNVWYTR